jgi:hypothetical protein
LVTAASSREARECVNHWSATLGHDCDKDCSWAAQPFHPEPAYFLYAINKMTGAMSLPDSAGGKSMCFVCLGNVPT